MNFTQINEMLPKMCNFVWELMKFWCDLKSLIFHQFKIRSNTHCDQRWNWRRDTANFSTYSILSWLITIEHLVTSQNNRQVFRKFPNKVVWKNNNVKIVLIWFDVWWSEPKSLCKIWCFVIFVGKLCHLFD